MKNLFSIIAIVLMALFASCESQNNGATGLDITSGKTYVVEPNGGDVYVTYAGASAVTTTILEGQECINNIKTPVAGVVIVNFRANTTGVARQAVVEISADGGDFTTLLLFNQTAGGNSSGNSDADVDFTALALDGYYYGEKYGEGADRYAFFLSDKGLNNGNQAYTDGTYYYIDCFAPANKTTSLPAGTYTFDSQNSGAPYTINSDNSQLILTGTTEEDTVSKPLSDAVLIVSANKIVLEATIDGELHKVTFYGDLTLEDASGENPDSGNNDDDKTSGQDSEGQSTLEGDRHVTFDGEHRAKWGYEGDYWQVGYSNYTIYIMNKSGGYVYGDTLQFDLITDNQSQNGDFDGEYTISNTPGRMVMMAGFTNKYAQAVGSWLYEYGGGSASGYKNYAMLKSGSAKFTNNGDGTHTVILDAYDCNGNNITCNWTGVIEED